eukprot:9221183-Pyramimonas_sp.AAC.1
MADLEEAVGTEGSPRTYQTGPRPRADPTMTEEDIQARRDAHWRRRQYRRAKRRTGQFQEVEDEDSNE